MIFGTSLAIQFHVICEEHGVYFLHDIGSSEDSLLNQHKSRARYPVYKYSLICNPHTYCRPCMGEWQMHELDNLEERPEPIDKPVLIFFGDSSLKLCRLLTPKLM